jgi:hypothetical protein
MFSNGMQKEAVALYPGAVALMNSQDVKPGMKVVRVDGHMPGEAGYPLDARPRARRPRAYGAADPARASAAVGPLRTLSCFGRKHGA